MEGIGIPVWGCQTSGREVVMDPAQERDPGRGTPELLQGLAPPNGPVTSPCSVTGHSCPAGHSCPSLGTWPGFTAAPAPAALRCPKFLRARAGLGETL